MTVLLRLLALVLFLGALLCGGCSLTFASLAAGVGGNGQALLLFLALGFLPAGLLAWAGLGLWRISRKSPPPPGPDDFR